MKNHQTQMLEMVSRTFALSISQLPESLRDPIGLAYLLFRVSDCIEDHAEIDVDRKVALLELWDAVLQEETTASDFVQQISDLDEHDPEVYVAKQADFLMDYLNTMPPELRHQMVDRVSRTTLGMARWQRQGPCVETEEELDDYMHQVAGRVGYLVTDIFAWHIPKINEQREALLPISRHCGLGLQTVNVIRGLRKDRVRGWFFMPRQYLDQVGITRSEFFHPEFEDEAMQVVDMLATKAERHLRYGLAYIAAFPQYLHRIRLACIWPLFFAIKTLAISRNNVQVVRSEVKITRQDVKTLVRQSTLLGWSNRWLSHQYDKLNGTKAI